MSSKIWLKYTSIIVIPLMTLKNASAKHNHVPPLCSTLVKASNALISPGLLCKNAGSFFLQFFASASALSASALASATAFSASALASSTYAFASSASPPSKSHGGSYDPPSFASSSSYSGFSPATWSRSLLYLSSYSSSDSPMKICFKALMAAAFLPLDTKNPTDSFLKQQIQIKSEIDKSGIGTKYKYLQRWFDCISLRLFA